MSDAYIVQAIRTAGGRRNGKLATWHPADMAGEVLNALVDRSGIDPAAIEDVILGCVSQVGEQSWHIGRNAVLASKLPDSVPAVSIDRQCGSSQQAVHFAAQAVMSGTQDVVIAAGVESMSRVPIGSPATLAVNAGLGGPWSKRIQDRYGVKEFSQFTGAQMLAEKYGFGRERLDEFALSSHQRAAKGQPCKGICERDPSAANRGRGAHRRRGHSFRRHAGVDRRGEAPEGGRGADRCQCESGLRRGRGRLDRQRARPEGPRAYAVGTHTQLDGDGRRSGDHARGADRRHPARAQTQRYEDRGHRSLRGQRGFRIRAPRVAPRSRCGPARR